MTEQNSAHAPVENHAEEPGLLSNILAIIGFIILIVIVIWGLVHIASLSKSWLSSLFGNQTNSITVSAPKDAASGVPIEVSWSYATLEKGTFAFLYECTSGFHFETEGATGAVNVPCGAAYAVPSAQKAMTVTPILSGATSTSVPVTVLFLPAATSSKQAQGSATIAVHASAASAPVSTPASTKSTAAPTKQQSGTAKPAASAPVYRGPADLLVRIVSTSIDANGLGTVVFNIANDGGSTSGTYYFTAQLPADGGYHYVSPAQAPLAPGSYIVSTLRFSQPVAGTVNITVDPESATGDVHRDNNTATQYFAGPTYNTTYYQQQNPQYQYPYYAY